MPTDASVATVTAKSSSAAPADGERDGQVRRDPGHDDLVDPEVAQDRQHLGAVHGRDALVPRQDQVVGPTPISGMTSMAGCDSSHSPLERVRCISGARRFADWPPASGRYVRCEDPRARGPGPGGQPPHRRPCRAAPPRPGPAAPERSPITPRWHSMKRTALLWGSLISWAPLGLRRRAAATPCSVVRFDSSRRSRPAHVRSPRSASTCAVSAPSSAAARTTGRARGGATATSGDVGSTGPASSADTPAIETSSSQRPPDADASQARVGRGESGDRVRDGIGTEHRRALVPDHQAATGGGVVPERNAAGSRRRSAVAR